MSASTVNADPASTASGTVPVTHSVIRADFLADEVARRYDIPGPLKGFLLYRGINDVYLIQGADERYALRVWRRSGRDVDVVAEELQFLDFLRGKSFSASTGIRARDGSLYFKLESPEGTRAVALYDWAPGRKFGDNLSVDTAARIGAAFARMHAFGLEWNAGRALHDAHIVEFRSHLPALLEFCYDRPDDLRDYPVLAERLADALLALRHRDVPVGICHRDFHPSNVHVDDVGRITLLDFDGTGVDYFMQDVQNYVWGSLFYGFDPQYAAAFEHGYESVRPFTADEAANKDLFLLAKTFRLIAGVAHSSTSVGRGTLRFRSMDWLGEYVRARARPLGLLP
jgi:Ser/Thr protein kinase RdoA (MazF antagonist)